MNILIGNNNLDPIYIKKNLNVVKSVEVIKFTGSVKLPVITITYDETLLTCNYCYIPELKRYYYIRDYDVNLKSITLYLSCDVLASFITDIYNSEAHVTRSNYGSKWLTDNLCLQTAKTSFEWRKLGGNVGDNSARYIVSIGGK